MAQCLYGKFKVYLPCFMCISKRKLPFRRHNSGQRVCGEECYPHCQKMTNGKGKEYLSPPCLSFCSTPQNGLAYKVFHKKFAGIFSNINKRTQFQSKCLFSRDQNLSRMSMVTLLPSGMSSTCHICPMHNVPFGQYLFLATELVRLTPHIQIMILFNIFQSHRVRLRENTFYAFFKIFLRVLHSKFYPCINFGVIF